MQLKMLFAPYVKQIQYVVDLAVTKKELDLGTAGLIKASMALRNLRVIDVMTPKAQVVQIRVSDSIETILAIMKDSSHSRYPVFEDDGQYPQGILLAKDFIIHSVSHEGFSLKEILRPPFYTPFSRRLHDLLNDFRRNRTHMALATDEHGLCIGVITIEDVLEQIVGEIEDEHDSIEEDRVIPHADARRFSIQADYLIDDFKRRFHFDLEEDFDFDTLGGFVTHLFGYLPAPGESVQHEGLNFKILQADRRKLLLIEVEDERKADGSAPFSLIG
jgi:magnesium and cobalt transporter